MKPLSLFLLLVLVCGCSKEASTPIIERVEKDGAGDVRAASAQAIDEWMRKKGTEYAVEIWRMCEPVVQKAASTWSDSTEGRICRSANSLRMFNWDSKAAPADPRKYQGGAK
jgi:hypothetical protein